MSQSMLAKGEGGQNLSEENEAFLKLLDLSDFQQTNNELFSSVSNTKRQLKRARGPSYRKIKTYYKSTKQYWKERNRRKKTWQLHGEGHTYKQIAAKLGISERTVVRDIKKIRPYYCRLSRSYFRKLDEERQTQLHAELKGKTLSQQFNILSRRISEYQKLMEYRRYLRHRITFTIDMDDMTDGCPAIKPFPSLSHGLSLYKPIYFKFQVKKDGEKIPLGEIRLG